ncbi:MAG: ATP-binding protein [Myxococcota bacterium]|nr:ATP-binding protein [Myxococcota bacterium]
MVYAVMLVSLSLDALAVAFVQPEMLRTAQFWVFFVPTAAGFGLVLAGRERPASWLLPLSLLAMAGYIFSLGGPPFQSPLAWALPLMVLAGALLLGTRGALIFGAVGVALGVGFFALSADGPLPGPGWPNSVRSYAVGYGIMLVLLTLYAAFGARGTERALVRAEERAEALAEARDALTIRAARGEALAALGRDIAEDMDAETLRGSAISRAAAELRARDVWWLEKREGPTWRVLASAAPGAPEEAASPLLDASETLGQVVRGDAPTRGGVTMAAAVSLGGGAAGIVAFFPPGASPGEHDAEFLEAIAHLVATALRHRAAAEEVQAGQRQLAASQRMEALGKLAGGVAHDFNNLLTILIGLRELLESEPLPDSARELIDEMGDLSERASALTGQLLTFARKRAGAPRRVDVGQAVAGLEPLLRRLVGPSVALTVDAAAETHAHIDPSQLEQVVMNLAVNARDAMRGDGRLEIAVDREGEEIVIAVRDSGVGMSEEIAAQIFEPFFTTKGDEGGTGLGLATVHGIVRRARGDIEVESRPGAGTIFRVRLPIDSEAPDREPPLADVAE